MQKIGVKCLENIKDFTEGETGRRHEVTPPSFTLLYIGVPMQKREGILKLAELMKLDCWTRAEVLSYWRLTPADYGMTPRQMGINPRALGLNLRAKRGQNE